MDIAFGTRNDCGHEIGKRGYEWWYYDIVTDDEEYGIVCIFFRNIPMLPECINAILSGYLVEDTKFDGLTISVYHKKQKIAQNLLWSKNRRTTFTILNDENTILAFGTNSVEYSNNKYTVNIDVLTSDERRIVLNAIIMPSVENFETPIQGNIHTHLWIPVAPNARTFGEIQLYDNGKKIEKKFTGKAYHDHNVSAIPVFEEFDEWYWGRAIFREFTLVYYYIPQSDKHEELQWCALFYNDKEKPIILSNVRIVTYKKLMNYSFLRYFPKLSITGYTEDNDFIDCTVSNKGSVESGPFYMRFLSRIVCRINGGYFYDNNAFTEYFSAKKLQSALVRTFIRLPWQEV